MGFLIGSRRLVVVVVAALLAVLLAFVIVPTGADAAPPGAKSDPTLSKGPVDSPTTSSKPLKEPTNSPKLKTSPTTSACASPKIEQRVLVLSAEGDEGKEPSLTSIKDALEYLGTPYEVYAAAKTPGGLTAAKLGADCNANYSGVVLATGSLAYHDGASDQWLSALSQEEWDALWAYEAKFGVRQVSWYTYPTADYGFQAPTNAISTSSESPYKANYTTAGQPVFSYANAANALKIADSYTYLAKPLSDGNTTPLVSDANGNALAAVRKYADGRENLALTFDSSKYSEHNSVLSYGLINWVSKGMFLGERRVYMNPQPDDFFLSSSTWAPNTPCGTDPDLTTTEYRITGNDLSKVINWQIAKQAQPNTKLLRIEMPFNGEGASGIYPNDTLTPAAKKNQAQFKWVSHTWDHEDMDAMNYATASSELSKNDQMARNLGLSVYNKSGLVTPHVSGLDNPEVLKAAYDNGVRNMVTDYSKPNLPNNGPNPTPNAGFYNSHQPSILMVPRRATNLFYNVSTPAEWTAEYNCLYRGYWGKDLSYNEILDKESEMMLSYLLKGDIDPLMFHQANLRAYDGTRTLMGDLIDRTLEKYNARFNLPIQSPTQEQIGQKMAERMDYNAAGVTASVVAGKSITISAQKAAKVPVTGLKSKGAEIYGGQPTTYVSLSAGQSVTLPLQ